MQQEQQKIRLTGAKFTAKLWLVYVAMSTLCFVYWTVTEQLNFC